jgi:hypothetical protein
LCHKTDLRLRQQTEGLSAALFHPCLPVSQTGMWVVRLGLFCPCLCGWGRMGHSMLGLLASCCM